MEHGAANRVPNVFPQGSQKKLERLVDPTTEPGPRLMARNIISSAEAIPLGAPPNRARPDGSRWVGTSYLAGLGGPPSAQWKALAERRRREHTTTTAVPSDSAAAAALKHPDAVQPQPGLNDFRGGDLQAARGGRMLPYGSAALRKGTYARLQKDEDSESYGAVEGDPNNMPLGTLVRLLSLEHGPHGTVWAVHSVADPRIHAFVQPDDLEPVDEPSSGSGLTGGASVMRNGVVYSHGQYLIDGKPVDASDPRVQEARGPRMGGPAGVIAGRRPAPPKGVSVPPPPSRDTSVYDMTPEQFRYYMLGLGPVETTHPPVSAGGVVPGGGPASLPMDGQGLWDRTREFVGRHKGKLASAAAIAAAVAGAAALDHQTSKHLPPADPESLRGMLRDAPKDVSRAHQFIKRHGGYSKLLLGRGTAASSSTAPGGGVAPVETAKAQGFDDSEQTGTGIAEWAHDAAGKVAGAAGKGAAYVLSQPVTKLAAKKAAKTVAWAAGKAAKGTAYLANAALNGSGIQPEPEDEEGAGFVEDAKAFLAKHKGRLAASASGAAALAAVAAAAHALSHGTAPSAAHQAVKDFASEHAFAPPAHKGMDYFAKGSELLRGGGPCGGDMSEEQQQQQQVQAPAGSKRKRASPHPSSSTMRRAALVSRIMKEKGMTLTEASSHVKGAGLSW